MKVMAALGLLVLLTGLLPGQEPNKDLSSLQGNWVGELHGKKVKLSFVRAVVFVLIVDDKQTSNGSIKIDPSKKPREMDLKINFGTTDRFKAGATVRGIYELDGDTLKWCVGDPTKEARPRAFPAKEGEEEYLYLVLKRVK